MKTIVYHDCVCSIVSLHFTIDGGALFRVRMEARTRVLAEMSEICLHKNEVSCYAYNGVNTIITRIERLLERQLFKDSADRMKGLASAVVNALNYFKSTVHIKKRDVVAASRAADEQSNIEYSTLKPEIKTKSDAQDEADCQNLLRLAAIGVKEGIAEVNLTKILTT